MTEQSRALKTIISSGKIVATLCKTRYQSQIHLKSFKITLSLNKISPISAKGSEIEADISLH